MFSHGNVVIYDNYFFSRYDEIKKYDFNNPRYIRGTGHFTQIVWKNSQKLGVGIAKKGREIVVVAQYSPHGNMLSRFKDNVMRINKHINYIFHIRTVFCFNLIDLVKNPRK